MSGYEYSTSHFSQHSTTLRDIPQYIPQSFIISGLIPKYTEQGLKIWNFLKKYPLLKLEYLGN